MEISLAYRIGLAERLQLPAQPLEMNFRLGVEVIPQTLDWVYSEVVKAEHTTQLIDWVTDQDFWTEYLESAHREQFDEMVIRAAAAFAHLDSQQNYTREQFTQSMNGIVTNFANERAVFYRRLTSHALQRHPGLALPVTPGG